MKKKANQSNQPDYVGVYEWCGQVNVYHNHKPHWFHRFMWEKCFGVTWMLINDEDRKVLDGKAGV